MSKVFYALEDYFDVVARERNGLMSGWLSRALGSLFALGGDLLAISISSRRI
jgi:hypothetical protein